MAYSQSLEKLRDIQLGIDYAVEQAKEEIRAKSRAEGRAEGEIKEKLENARNLKALGVDYTIISKALGLSIEEINNL